MFTKLLNFLKGLNGYGIWVALIIQLFLGAFALGKLDERMEARSNLLDVRLGNLEKAFKDEQANLRTRSEEYEVTKRLDDAITQLRGTDADYSERLKALERAHGFIQR